MSATHITALLTRVTVVPEQEQVVLPVRILLLQLHLAANQTTSAAAGLRRHWAPSVEVGGGPSPPPQRVSALLSGYVGKASVLRSSRDGFSRVYSGFTVFS